MYLPKQFEETRAPVLHGFIRQRSFGTLVALTSDGLSVDHLPFLLDGNHGALGVVRGHVARANPIVKAALADVDAVVIFNGPDHYITPSWYATKQKTGRVVPTWNYVVVHAYGRPRFIDDEQWLRQHVEQATQHHESGRDNPWQVSDAPDDYVSKLIGNIVGVEIPISRLSGKWKLGQNRPDADRQGMVDGLLEDNG
ncbi:MAG TPA: FMN-binding negative transcriptional regulator [Polyangia bacterium]|jgi:transcriptional regulator|nr:FMN-binding negative transcriptional regulator [Polyangia bacterium]